MNAFKRTFGFIHQHPLAKKHLFRAYFKFISWQIKSRLNPNFQKVKFLDNTYFLGRKKLTGITGNIYTGLHEFNEMGFLLHFLKAEDTFFDVGANIGSYTLLASSVLKAHTIAFEPVPNTFNILKKNIELNHIENLVQLENKGVGKENASLRFSANEDTTNHVIANNEEGKDTILVPIVTLNDYVHMAKPVLIKIDVEGFETEVLNGASLLLTNTTLKAIIIELNGSGDRYGYDENQIHEKLMTHSFKPYSYNPFDRKIEELPRFGAFNTIYIRDTHFVNERLKGSTAFKIFNQEI
ncbi:MAG: FkbM family methyltransferase [Pedobacter sp.]|nr:MAG: FkbM family methyltransferase [Pedobacter sp.]